MKGRIYPVAIAVMLALYSPPIAWAEGGSPIAPETVPQPERSAFMDMLNYIYRENPRLLAEREAVSVADERTAQANAGFRPTLNGNIALGRQRQKVDDGDWSYGEATSGSLVAEQPLFNGFGTLEQKRAASARVNAARARLLAVEQGVLLTAITDWLEVCEKEKVVMLNEENVSRMRSYAGATEQRFKAGDGTSTDVAQAESRLAQAEAGYASAIAAAENARANFTRDTGLTVQNAGFNDLPPGLPGTREEAEQTASNNPEMSQAEYEQVAAEHDIGYAKSSLWPRVSLRASASQEHSPALGLDKLRNDAVTLNISIPLYQGGGEYSRIREAKLLREKSRYDALDIGRNIVERARISWHNYIASKSIINASQRALEAANRALSGVHEEQRQGLRTLTEVLDEQSEVLSAAISEVEAQKNLRLEAYRLLAATGKLTGQHLRLDEPLHDPKPHFEDVVPQWAGY